MKRTVLFLMIVAVLSMFYTTALAHPQPEPIQAASTSEDADSWTGRDKREHFIASAGFGFLAAGVFHEQSAFTQWSIAMIPGVVKEWSDKQSGGQFSKKDLVWDALGAAIGVAGGRIIVRKNFVGVELRN